jgi:hypothetical protein
VTAVVSPAAVYRTGVPMTSTAMRRAANTAALYTAAGVRARRSWSRP